MVNTDLLETDGLIVHDIRVYGDEYRIAYEFRGQWRPNTLPLMVFLRHYHYLQSRDREQAGHLMHKGVEKLNTLEKESMDTTSANIVQY
jgi:hypothetical protein